MIEPTEELVQLATRVPKRLHREVKLHCVGSGQTVMEFVVEALRDRLAARRPARRDRRRPN